MEIDAWIIQFIDQWRRTTTSFWQEVHLMQKMGAFALEKSLV